MIQISVHSYIKIKFALHLKIHGFVTSPKNISLRGLRLIKLSFEWWTAFQVIAIGECILRTSRKTCWVAVSPLRHDDRGHAIDLPPKKTIARTTWKSSAPLSSSIYTLSAGSILQMVTFNHRCWSHFVGRSGERVERVIANNDRRWWPWVLLMPLTRTH